MSTYCAVSDLLTGDVPFPARFGDGSAMVQRVTDLMDAQLGQFWVTPILLSNSAADRPALLMLKQINALIASGRIMMDLEAAGDEVNKYGLGMFQEGLGYLNAILSGEFKMPGATPINPTSNDDTLIKLDQDPLSLTEAFYTNTMQGKLPVQVPIYVAPYGNPFVWPGWPV